MKSTKRILLVDDDADDQLYFCDALKELQSGHDINVANNGLEALQKIEIPPPPDLIFLDLNMPVMNGYECLTCIKRDERYKGIPVIIFTTSKNPLDVERTKRMGADLYFTKPANFSLLCTKLKQLFSMDIKEVTYTF